MALDLRHERPARSLGLAGPTFALIQQPVLGWGRPAVIIPGLAGTVLLVAFVAYERRAPEPMLPLGSSRRRDFAFGNLETSASAIRPRGAG